MPDRPKVVITLISTSDDDEKKIIKAMAAHEEAFLNVHSIKVFDIPHRLFYLGFDPDTPVTLSDFLATLSGIPFAEGAIYVDGKPALRIAKLKLE